MPKPRNRLKGCGKRLRQSCTDAETLLWGQLRDRQVEGGKFRRQEEIEEYVVDFLSYEKKVAIELDGGQHAIKVGHDRSKDKCLRANGYLVLRFWDNDVFNNLAGVLEVIRLHCL